MGPSRHGRYSLLAPALEKSCRIENSQKMQLGRYPHDRTMESYCGPIRPKTLAVYLVWVFIYGLLAHGPE